ncbi:MAG: ptpS [Ignavibacteria bacterium]|nr:ptpS [Ignavibacteria bacterium]
MKASIAKEYRWEMSHRLPCHNGMCKNIHGHSYKMRVEITGSLGENDMIMDYYSLDKIILPFVQALDHSFLCDEGDSAVLEFLSSNGFKHSVIKGSSTVENIAWDFVSKVKPLIAEYKNIELLKIRVYETEDSFAEVVEMMSL